MIDASYQVCDGFDHDAAENSPNGFQRDHEFSTAFSVSWRHRLPRPFRAFSNAVEILMDKRLNISGMVFGRLTAVEFASNTSAGKARWVCLCLCGKTKTVYSDNLVRGLTRSCGCLSGKGDPDRQRIRFPSEYSTWSSMKARCLNPKGKQWPDYGGRGIGICKEWVESFAAFYNHIGPKPSPLHSIDRINNNGNYEPGNVRWATRVDQQNNTRWNRLLTFNGKTQSIAMWSRELKISKEAIRGRLNRGWSAQETLTCPLIGQPKPTASL